MKRLALLSAISLSVSLSLPAHAQVKVDQPWVRATFDAQKTSGAYMTLKSDQPVSLVSASSPAAKIVEIHEMKMENNVMNMQAVSKIDIAPGKPVELKPGGYHVMLIDLVKPLSKGDVVPMTLEFKGADGKSTRQEIKAMVRDMASGPAAH